MTQVDRLYHKHRRVIKDNFLNAFIREDKNAHDDFGIFPSNDTWDLHVNKVKPGKKKCVINHMELKQSLQICLTCSWFGGVMRLLVHNLVSYHIIQIKGLLPVCNS